MNAPELRILLAGMLKAGLAGSLAGTDQVWDTAALNRLALEGADSLIAAAGPVPLKHEPPQMYPAPHGVGATFDELKRLRAELRTARGLAAERNEQMHEAQRERDALREELKTKPLHPIAKNEKALKAQVVKLAAEIQDCRAGYDALIETCSAFTRELPYRGASRP